MGSHNMELKIEIGDNMLKAIQTYIKAYENKCVPAEIVARGVKIIIGDSLEQLVNGCLNGPKEQQQDG